MKGFTFGGTGCRAQSVGNFVMTMHEIFQRILFPFDRPGRGRDGKQPGVTVNRAPPLR